LPDGKNLGRTKFRDPDLPHRLRLHCNFFGSCSKPEIAQRRMIVGARQAASGTCARFLDWQIVDAGDAQTHQPVLVEFPVLIAVAAEPGAAVVMPLIGEAHAMRLSAKSPEFLDQAVVKLTMPLACLGTPRWPRGPGKTRAIAPAAVFRIGKRDARGIARVPGVFGQTRLLGAVSAVKGEAADGSLYGPRSAVSGRLPPGTITAPAGLVTRVLLRGPCRRRHHLVAAHIAVQHHRSAAPHSFVEIFERAGIGVDIEQRRGQPFAA